LVAGSGIEVDRPEVKTQLVRLIRRRIASHIVDLSGAEPNDCAIYTLADPRDIRDVRYIGQTSGLRRRFLQHLNAARLWLPDELPWWIKRAELRPLYQWIRGLYLDEGRLPVMAVVAWVPAADALAEERKHICAHLGHRSALLNRESETFKKQPLLL
jgi:hypothetical protein